MTIVRTVLTVAALALLAPAVAQEPAMDPTQPTITAEEWQVFRDAFVGTDGRVIDTLNGNISHSEGQGYGLLLAVLAGDRASFERIWSFTQTDLLIRADDLVAWRWEPDARPNVTDINNASDGDILVANALLRAGETWGDASKIEAAARIVRALEANVITDIDGLTMILPGVTGFTAAEREDGPVINPSYWVFEAFPLFTQVSPDGPWPAVDAGGLTIIDRLTTPAGTLPADWMSLASDPAVPAADFPPEFSYNNIRIPLYLMRAGAAPDLLAHFRPLFSDALAPARIDVTTGMRLEEMTEAGYRIIGAALHCVLDGTSVPQELLTLETYSYYGATLQLLTLDFLRRDHPECLSGGEGTSSLTTLPTMVGALP